MDHYFAMASACAAIDQFYRGNDTFAPGGAMQGVSGQLRAFHTVGKSQVNSGSVTCLYDDGTVIAVVAGVFDAEQAQQVGIGYMFSDSMRDVGGANLRFHDAASDIISRTFTSDVTTYGREIYLIGHSAGGAIAEVMARQLVRNGYGRVIKGIFTMGAPKPGFAGVAVETQGVRRIRYMNFDDPVPLVPNATLAPGRALEVCIPQAARASFFGLRGLAKPGNEPEPWRCVHGSGGSLISAGTMTACQEARCLPSAASALNRWMNHDANAGRAHNVNTYKSFFESRIGREDDAFPSTRERDVNGQSTPRPRLVVPYPLGIQTPPSLVLPIATSSRSSYAVEGGGSGALVNERTGTVAQSKIAPFMQFKKSKMGNQWAIILNDALVASCNTPSKANTFCRAGNKMLRAMGNGLGVRMPQFTDALAAWVTAASQTGNGVEPPINVQS